MVKPTHPSSHVKTFDTHCDWFYASPMYFSVNLLIPLKDPHYIYKTMYLLSLMASPHVIQID